MWGTLPSGLSLANFGFEALAWVFLLGASRSVSEAGEIRFLSLRDRLAGAGGVLGRHLGEPWRPVAETNPSRREDRTLLVNLVREPESFH